MSKTRRGTTYAPQNEPAQIPTSPSKGLDVTDSFTLSEEDSLKAIKNKPPLRLKPKIRKGNKSVNVPMAKMDVSESFSFSEDDDHIPLRKPITRRKRTLQSFAESAFKDYELRENATEQKISDSSAKRLKIAKPTRQNKIVKEIVSLFEHSDNVSDTSSKVSPLRHSTRYKISKEKDSSFTDKNSGIVQEEKDKSESHSSADKLDVLDTVRFKNRGKLKLASVPTHSARFSNKPSKQKLSGENDSIRQAPVKIRDSKKPTSRQTNLESFLSYSRKCTLKLSGMSQTSSSASQKKVLSTSIPSQDASIPSTSNDGLTQSRAVVSTPSEVAASTTQRKRRRPTKQYIVNRDYIKDKLSRVWGYKVSADVIGVGLERSEEFFDRITRNLDRRVRKDGRDTITREDVVDLMKDKGLISTKQDLYKLLEESLPYNALVELVPRALAGNVVKPDNHL